MTSQQHYKISKIPDKFHANGLFFKRLTYGKVTKYGEYPGKEEADKDLGISVSFSGQRRLIELADAEAIWNAEKGKQKQQEQLLVDTEPVKDTVTVFDGLTVEEANELPNFDEGDDLPAVEDNADNVQPIDEHSTGKIAQSKQQDSPSEQTLLDKLLSTEQDVGILAQQKVVFSPPLITRHEAGIIGRSTVNIVQGAFGSHKSRLAELFASLMLTTNSANDPQFLEFKRAMIERFCLAYIDTERNKKEELPSAIQGIKIRAGYKINDSPLEFRFTSIKGVERKDRFRAIETFIHHVRANTTLHVFCVIDVVTDAIGDFNDPKESMKLFDFLGNLCDNYDATFLLVIHQNPGTEKARGHTGTEAANKASTVLQIGIEKDANGNDTGLIKLRYLKMRRGKKPEAVFLEFCEETNGLQLAGADAIAAHQKQRKHKADAEDVAERLTSLLADGPMLKGDVVQMLESEFGAKNATIRERLKTIIAEEPLMTNDEGRAVRLGEYREGQQQYYKLEIIKDETTGEE